MVAEVERHRHDDVQVRPRLRISDQALRQLVRQELGVVDGAAVGDGGVHLGQAAGGDDAVGGRNLAVEEWNIALHKRFDAGKEHRPERAGER